MNSSNDSPKQTKSKTDRKPAGVREKELIAKEAKELKILSDSEDGKNISINHIVFAHLIAEEGYNFHDAYVRAFKPGPDIEPTSVSTMASRAAKKTADLVKKIRIDNASELLALDERKMRALNSREGIADMTILLHHMFCDPDRDDKTRLRSMELYGKLKSVDAFSTSSSTTNNNLVLNGIDTTKPVSEVKLELMNSLKNMLLMKQPSRP